MKKVFCFAVLCLGVFWTGISAQTSAGGLEISFGFKRQTGFSTNQFAVWIEDNRGNFVKTLYATKFTASGGWSKRPQSIPLWVSRSGLSGLDKKDIDAFSGATPRTGTISYRWDGTDKNGNNVAPGEYRVLLEATLKEDTKVLYSSPFTLGGSSTEAELRPDYSGSRTKERDMIENVKISYRP